MESKEVGRLSSLKRDEGPMGVMPSTSPRKLAIRKQARIRLGHKRAKDRCAEQLNATHQPNQMEETPLGDEATQEPNMQRPIDNGDVDD